MTCHPSAKNTEDRNNDVDGHKVGPAVLDIQVAGLLEVVREPDKKKPPHRIGEKLGNDEGPRLRISQQTSPGHFRLRLRFIPIAEDMREFIRIKSFFSFRHFVKYPPGDEPEEACNRRDDISAAPAETQRDEWNGCRRNDACDIR